MLTSLSCNKKQGSSHNGTGFNDVTPKPAGIFHLNQVDLSHVNSCIYLFVYKHDSYLNAKKIHCLI